MATTVTAFEVSKDPTGLIIQKTTTESFDAGVLPSSAARSWTQTTTDGKTTTVEEVYASPSPWIVSYSIDVASLQAPIETHPKIRAFQIPTDEIEKWIIWKKNPTDGKLGTWTPAMSGNVGIQTLFAYYKEGVTDYMSPRATVKYTEISNSPPNILGVGYIQSADISPIPLPAGFNFIFMGCSGQQEGTEGKWHNTYEYLGSGALGWDSFLYTQ